MSRIFSIMNTLDEYENNDLNFNTLNVVICTSSVIFIIVKTCNLLGLC
ncbi:hypothetical protein QJ854_gp190 [Moumouvirus goulette]|uniref:Uncharacterized protein n=1 Tax=Moumouvirus goulette TaxID=1247379 RepID=M1PXU0_9VIRU|nr:hypothetical protein QJ854_gp190 [Moumouvirus goulette]AGF85592.1 hypothetical protein glt_00787 [Moumouvirus goulette]